MRLVVRVLWASLLLTIILPKSGYSEDVLELNRSFVEKYKNRLTISVPYYVDAAHKRPNPPEKDGDMHVAGRSADVGLATVAEIQNAKDVPNAVQIIKNVEGTGQTASLTGVWRIWPEHGGDHEHLQQIGPGSPYTGTGPTNPPHVFEIHPILRIEQEDLSATLKPIEGFETKDAEDAFNRYERAASRSCQLVRESRCTCE
jgi:hypothetical protein